MKFSAACLCALALFLPAAASGQATLMPMPILQFSDQFGTPLAGGFVYTCVTGSSCPGTPLAAYTDASATVQLQNPIPLNAAGEQTNQIWLGVGLVYKIVVTDLNGVVQASIDPVVGPPSATPAANGASSINFTPSATGGQTRSVAAIFADSIDAANYDTLTHAFADACAATPGKLVVIPAGVSSGSTYTNSCNAPVLDLRVGHGDIHAGGTPTLPATQRDFVHPNIGIYLFSNTVATNNNDAHGDLTLAPALKIITYESGSAATVPFYFESNFLAGMSGSAYSGMIVVQAYPGSRPNVVAHNWVWTDSSYILISTCARASNVVTCTLNLGGTPYTPTNTFQVSDFVYISGYSDSSFNSGSTGFSLTAVGTNTITFAETAADASGGSGGVVSRAHQAFGFELDQFNNSHDPGFLTPVSAQNVQPVWGITNTSVGTFPITAAFYAVGPKYHGFFADDALDSIFTAGYPIAGGASLKALAAFRARPRAVATAGVNYPSLPYCWDRSTSLGGSAYVENTICATYIPASMATGAVGKLQFGLFGGTFFAYIDESGHFTADSGTSGAVAYGFAGWTNGIYNNAGVTDVAGGFKVDGATNSVGGYSTNGTVGVTTTVTCTSGQHINSLTIVGGIITVTPTCN